MHSHPESNRVGGGRTPARSRGQDAAIRHVLQVVAASTPRIFAVDPGPATAVVTQHREPCHLMPNLRTFLVEDSPVIRSNLIAALEDLAPVEVVGSAETAREACIQLSDLAAEGACDLVIVDIFLKSGSGLDVLRYLREQDLPLRSVVLTNYATPEISAQCRLLGASEVFDKSHDIEALVQYCTELAEA